jgi:hypothetical protein
VNQFRLRTSLVIVALSSITACSLNSQQINGLFSATSSNSVEEPSPAPAPSLSPPAAPTPLSTPLPTLAPSCGLTPEELLPAWAKEFVPLTEIYVSPSGNDHNDGLSPSRALRTAAKAVSKLGPGVRLNFATGTYSCSGLFIQDIKGGTERPASIRSSDGPRLAKFDCAGSGGILFNFVQGFIVEGIELYYSSYHGIQIMSGSPGPWPDPTVLSSDIVVHNSFIHNNRYAGIKASQSQNLTFIGNEFSHVPSSHMAIEAVAVDNGIIAGNYGHDSNGYFDEIKGGANGGIIFHNLVLDSTRGIIAGGDETGYQYLVHTKATYEVQNLRVWDNMISNVNDEAFRIVGCTSCEIVNNTYYSNNPTSAQAVIRFLSDRFVDKAGYIIRHIYNANVHLHNNIFLTPGKFNYMIAKSPTQDAKQLIMSNNSFWWAAGGIVGSDVPFLRQPNSLYVDPDLASPPANMHPLSASPVIEKGQLSNVSTDNWDGVCWSGNPNMGAY